MKYILALLLIPNFCYASPEEEAVKQALTAAYKQAGIESRVKDTLENMVSKKHKELIKKVSPMFQLIYNKRIEFKWDF